MSSKGIAPSEEKVSAVQNASCPQSIGEIRSSLGLVQYGTKFLPGFPAQNADEKRPTVYVGRRPEEILPLMERSAKRAETLAYFKNECGTVIVADAGPTGIGAVLT